MREREREEKGPVPPGPVLRLLSAFSPRLASGCREGDDLSIVVACERDAVDGNAASCRVTAAVTGHPKVLKSLLVLKTDGDDTTPSKLIAPLLTSSAQQHHLGFLLVWCWAA